MRKSLSKAADRRRFRQMMFESLEGRALLAGVEVPVADWQNADFVNNEVMVRFNSGVTRAQASNELFVRQGATIKQWWSELNLAEVQFPMSFPMPSAQIGVIQSIHNWSSVYYAEPNFIREARRTPNDPGFGQQWSHENTGQAVNLNPFPIPPGLFPGTPDADVDSTEAWDYLVGSPNTIIAIIDTGVDYRHPDLAANIWTNPGEIPDSIDNDGNGYIDDIFGWNFADGNNDPDDLDGHGTHVAGIAAAVGNNGIGVAGVNWNSKIMSIKAGNPGFTTSSIAGAQLYIAKMRSQYGFNIVVSNNSYGASGAPFSFVEYDSIVTSSNAGIPFVTSAGNAAVNNDTIPDYPSTYLVNGLISVASTDNNDVLSTFSQYGLTTVDLAAPGEQILSTVPPFYNPPFNYDYFDGTSMASPIVAGAVGLLRSLDPNLTVSQVKNFILQGVDQVPNLATRVLTGGRLNIAKSLDLVPRNEIRGTVFLDVNGSATFDGTENGIAGWTVYLDLNNNGVFNTNEPSALSAANGTYLLRGIFGPGTFNVRPVIQATYRQTFPVASAAQSVTLATKTSIVNAVNFGVQEVPGEIHGRKWNDLNGDGVMDPGEPGIQGVVIYVDVNNDNKIALGEPAAVTDQFGNYTILNVAPSVAPSTYFVREVYQPGFLQIFPDPLGTDLGANAGVIVTRGTVTPGINFGNRAAFDYGDAPAPYPTLISQGGAVHGFLQGFYLGARADVEANGVPSANANGDDLNAATDDEDGVILSNLVPGQGATATVTSSTGTFAAGYLQGFIDYNRDGDWNDSGEKIFNDVQLTTGTTTLNFTVPITAGLGPSYARFRYSLQHGIGPKGTALGGEVEDYRVAILGTNPTAVDDAFTVDNDSLLFQNRLLVLANDLPSATGPAGINPAGLDLTGTQGQVVLDTNSTPSDPTDDFYTYQPPTGFIGVDTFKYTDRDPAGHVSAPATVTVTVRFVPRDPIAVDNTFDVLVGSSANKLDVMANDVQGTGGAVRFLTQTPPTALHGTVIVDTNGTATNFNDDFYRYTPTAGYEGEDSFSYTIIDGLAKTSTGKVTVQVLNTARTPFNGALVQFELQVVDKVTGLPLPDGALIPLGTSILVRGVVTDIRPPGSAIDNSQVPPIDFAGVFSGYMDLLYDRTKVQPFGPIVFGGEYQDQKAGFGGTPGLIDEIGATYSGTEDGPGSLAKRVFTKEFLTTGAGNLQFVADPADISPDHDITVFIVDPNPLLSDIQSIPPTQVYYKPSFPNISVLGSGEGDDTNLWMPVDVNLDGVVSPIDALLVVNYLNENLDPSGGGEGGPVWKRDVNHDNEISPVDALMVINFLNRPKPLVPAGEGEGEADFAAPLSPIVLTSPSAGSSSGVSTDSGAEAPAPVVHAASVDSLLGQTDWDRPSVCRSEDSPDTKPDESSDEFFTNLGTPIRRNRKG